MTEPLHNANVVIGFNPLARLKAEVARRGSETATARITYDLS